MVSIPAGSSLGRYRIIEQLGRGGMATVFRCHDPNLDRYVAVKVLPSFEADDPTFIKRFEQEAQTVARLSHPNILQIFDFGEDKGFNYIVSELVAGGDLQDKLKGGESLTVKEVIGYMGPLAEALDYAHREGVIHRDLKPANVLLDEKDRPILADFGLARMMESAVRFTQAQQALGTPEYMAPEQAMGADADHRSDLYAFGIMVYQMLVGQTPFHADTPAATLMAHVHSPLPLPTALDPDIEPRTEAVLLKSLAKEPNDRFQSATEFMHGLALAGGETPPPLAEDGGATAVMDMCGAQTEVMDAAAAGTDAATAAMDAPAGATRTVGAPSTPAQPAPKVGGRPPILLYAAIAIVAVIVAGAAGFALFVLPGDTEADGSPGDGVPVQPPADGASPPALVGATTTTPEGSPTPEPAPTITLAQALVLLEDLTVRAEENVTKIRSLQPESAIDPQLRTRDQLESITRGLFRREDLRDQVFEAQELYKLLDLMDENEDLEEILIGIQIQQVYALFDDEAEQVFVLSDATEVGPVQELAYASAFMGGIQQDQFNVKRLRRQARLGGADEFRALSALISGDVSQVNDGYENTVFTQDDIDVLRQPLPDNKLLAAPDIVRKTLLFPQREGFDFVAELFGREGAGWPGVDEAYTKPPFSTEQVLHTDKYFADEVPHVVTLPNISGRLGTGWTQVSNNVLGEFLIRSYLEEHLDDTQAAAAASGWGGDRYTLLSGPEGQRLLLAMLNWDAFEDADEFVQAYTVFAGVKIQQDGGTSEVVEPDGRKWVTDTRTIFLGQVGPSVLLVIGEDERTVEEALFHLFEALEQALG